MQLISYINWAVKHRNISYNQFKKAQRELELIKNIRVMYWID